MKNSIESVVCRIMNHPNNTEIENNFEILKTYMNKQQIYNEELHEYNVAGPKIAESLVEDYLKFNDTDIIKVLFNNYINIIGQLINNNQVIEAISKLKEMIEVLEDYYNISASKIIEQEKELKMGPPKNVKMKKLGTYPGYIF